MCWERSARSNPLIWRSILVRCWEPGIRQGSSLRPDSFSIQLVCQSFAVSGRERVLVAEQAEYIDHGLAGLIHELTLGGDHNQQMIESSLVFSVGSESLGQ